MKPHLHFICTIDGCERKHCARGLCRPHYRKWVSENYPEGIPKKEKTSCSIPGCEDDGRRARGMCIRHYESWRHTERVGTGCSINGCNIPSHARSMCEVHYHHHMITVRGRVGDPWRVWHSGMIGRCYSPQNNNFFRYGGRGILVADEWHSFTAWKAAILSSIGDRPTPMHSLDRINNDLGYQPGNLRWATKKEQANNRRSSKFNDDDRRAIGFAALIGINMRQISEETGMSYGYVRQLRAVRQKERHLSQ